MRETLFVADLHLSDHTPELKRLFFRFLQDKQPHADALYILGDLFEVWLGDDDDSETARETAAALHAFSACAPVYFICGNRDFLLGSSYARRAGMTLLPETALIELYGRRCLISHGDEMCSADRGYQIFRRIIRCPLLDRLLLRLPRRFRRRTAERLRQISRHKKAQNGYTPRADVTEAGVQRALRQHPRADVLIHGHTHRPAEHRHHFQNRSISRYVLADWYGSQGGCLAVSADGIRAETFRAE